MNRTLPDRRQLRHLLLVVLCLGFLAVRATSAVAGSSDSGEPLTTFQQHKILHFALSDISTEALEKGGQLTSEDHGITWANRWVSSLFVLSLGAAKEVYDHKMSGETLPGNVRDFSIDVLGTLTGNLLQWQF